MNGQFEQAIANPQNPASVFLMRREEISSLSMALSQMSVRPLPTSVLSSQDEQSMRNLELRFWCSEGTSNDDEEIRIQCNLDTDRSVSGAASSSSAESMHVSVVCSLRHAFSQGDLIPCTKLIHVGDAEADENSLFHKAHWASSIQKEIQGAVWNVVGRLPDGESGTQGHVEHTRFGLPLPYDPGSVHDMRFKQVACCPADPALPCPQPWDKWSACSKPCDGGTQSRGRDVYTTDEDSTLQVHRENQTRPCNTQPCCTFGSCRPMRKYPCKVFYGDGDTDFVTAKSSKEKFATALGHLGKRGTTVLDGGVQKGSRAPNTTLCDGTIFTGDTCSFSDTCKDLDAKPCEVPCALELPAHIEPKYEVDDFPRTLDEYACGSIKSAVHTACVSGAFSSDACAQFLGKDFSLSRFLGACRRKGGEPMSGVVVDPAAATSCKTREISDRTIDSILNQIDILMRDEDRMKNLTTADVMYDVRCCSTRPRTGPDTPLNDALGCDDSESSAGQGLQASAADTKAIRSA